MRQSSRQSSTSLKPRMIPEKSLDHAWKHVQSLNDISRLADTKASAMLAAAGVIMGLILRQNPIPTGNDVMHITSSMLLIAATFALGVSVIFSMRALMPRPKLGKRKSPFYFNSVARDYSLAHHQQFLTDYHKLIQDNAGLLDELSEQAFATSLIVARKLQAIRQAIWLLVGGVLLLGLGVALQIL